MEELGWTQKNYVPPRQETYTAGAGDSSLDMCTVKKTQRIESLQGDQQSSDKRLS